MTKFTKLGNTKLQISKLGIGGAAFKDHTDSKHAKEVVETALKNGGFIFLLLDRPKTFLTFGNRTKILNNFILCRYKLY